MIEWMHTFRNGQIVLYMDTQLYKWTHSSTCQNTLTSTSRALSSIFFNSLNNEDAIDKTEHKRTKRAIIPINKASL